MSDSASVVLDFEADASDALLLWIDPLRADALDFSSSVDGFDRQAHKSPELDSRPHDFRFGEGPPRPEPPAWLALAGATPQGPARDRQAAAARQSFLDVDAAPTAPQSGARGRQAIHRNARGGTGIDRSAKGGKPPTAPSDARTQGAPRGSATQATEDVAARSPVADGGIAADNGLGGFERGGVSGVHGRSGAGAKGLLPPHNSTAPNFESLTAAVSAQQAAPASTIAPLSAEPAALAAPRPDLRLDPTPGRPVGKRGEVA